MPTKNLKIHFIGIGGIGVSALAQYYLAKGCQVSGSDLASSEITQALEKKGVEILIGRHGTKNLLKDTNLAVYSPAVQKDNPELKEARKLGIKCLSYPQALGELTRQHFTIAVSGTHGKSTTATMLGLLLTKAGFDPTVIVGTKVKEFGDSNFKAGKSKFLVIEADEHFGSFLNYWPKIIILTNIEKDHLDYYKNLNNVLKTYKEYLGHLPEDGILIANGDDENVQGLAPDSVFYSLKQKESDKLKKILKVPGKYNIYNALAVLTVARALKIPDETSFKTLGEYEGCWRRFEILKAGETTIVSDYAHHPTEIEAALQAAREKWPQKEIWCIFQPHQYQRTYYLFDDFVKVFSAAPIDKLIITDIYDVAGRENTKIKKQTSSKKLVKAANRSKVMYLPMDKIADYAKERLRGGEILIIMGAGDVYNLVGLFHRGLIDRD